jgi:hypothetical protein
MRDLFWGQELWYIHDESKYSDPITPRETTRLDAIESLNRDTVIKGKHSHCFKDLAAKPLGPRK